MPETECEFTEPCETLTESECDYLDALGACDARRMVLTILNSPKFKKQYANREELVEEIGERSVALLTAVPTFVIKIIRTHGLEE